MSGAGEAFRALHDAPELFVTPNPWDIGSARILAAMGFKALATTSAGMAYGLGVCEGEVTRPQQIEHLRLLVDATPLPVSADLEKGFGDTPDSVAETIRVVSETGLAGGSIEDFTGNLSAPIFDIGLAAERIAAAAEACRHLPEDFVLTARAEGLCYGHTDLNEIITRLQAYEAAGADVLYAPGLNDLASIRMVCEAVSKPVNVVMGMPGTTFLIEELAQAGVKRVSVGSAFFRVAYGAMIASAREIVEEGAFTQTQDGIGFAEIETFFERSPTR